MHNTNILCGCTIEYEGDAYHQDYSIDWCPLHRAAPELLQLTELALVVHQGVRGIRGIIGKDYEAELRRVIAKATNARN